MILNTKDIFLNYRCICDEEVRARHAVATNAREITLKLVGIRNDRVGDSL